MLLHNALGEKSIVCQEPLSVQVLLVVTVFCLHRVTAQQNAGFGGTIYLVGENCILDLSKDLNG
jgi:hypothetical protein